MKNFTAEQLMNMSEDERIALIFRLALYSEKQHLGKDIEEVIVSHHSHDYLSKALLESKIKGY